MLATVRTFTLDGISARPVRVEVDVHRGLPNFTVVGLPDPAVREMRERVRAAIVNSGYEFPLRRIVVNLAPASLRKAGPGMDLAIAAALLAASAQVHRDELTKTALVGELALDGSTRPISGALAMAELARDAGAEAIILPAENASEAALADGIRVIPLQALEQIPRLLSGDWQPPHPDPMPLRLTVGEGAPDLADLRGQEPLRDALEVAAAGGHGLLMVGPPGAGKSLAASRLPSILPPLARSEALEVTRIASACGRLGAHRPGGRPFRAPHHTVSPAALIGGGTPSRPGEATLAHRGVLFLDELPEFRRETLEALHAPMKAGTTTVARAGRTQRFPAHFILVAAANPCPCGRGPQDPHCSCAPHDVGQYRAKLDAALADTVQIAISVQPPSVAEISGPPGESSAAIRDRVCAARDRQAQRLGPFRCNSEMTSEETRACPLDSEAATTIADLYATRRLDARAHDNVLRIAQTYSDLAGAEEIGKEAIGRALRLERSAAEGQR